MHISAINKANITSTLKFLVVIPWAIMARLWGKDTWIITERSDQARDNGYCFYKYVRENYPEQRIVYIIEKGAPDYKKIRKYKAIVWFDSIHHYYYYCLSKIHISAHVGGCNPTTSPITRYLKKLLSIKDVFLPHGVSYGIAEFCLKKNAKIDLFICSGFPEYENVLKHYGYTEEEVAYTGFPRLDFWWDIKVNEKKILLMPTWRMYIAQHPEIDIRNTLFFKTYQSLINNDKLASFLEQNDIELDFYLHHGMQKYISFFSTNCSKIRIIQPDDNCDIQELLKTSALLVTDYSSVHFDFAYMNKPVIYFQFDREEFYSRQYAASEFDAEADGFGPVNKKADDVINTLMTIAEREYVVDDVYKTRMRAFYQLYDNNNCERVYQTIKNKCYK